MVTCVPVDASYDFPRTELAAMSSNIARLIEDIDRLDINRRNMMEELKVLRDVTLYYNEQHPELRATEKANIEEDEEASSEPEDGNNASARTCTPEMEKKNESKESTKQA